MRVYTLIDANNGNIAVIFRAVKDHISLNKDIWYTPREHQSGNPNMPQNVKNISIFFQL